MDVVCSQSVIYLHFPPCYLHRNIYPDIRYSYYGQTNRCTKASHFVVIQQTHAFLSHVAMTEYNSQLTQVPLAACLDKVKHVTYQEVQRKERALRYRSLNHKHETATYNTTRHVIINEVTLTTTYINNFYIRPVLPYYNCLCGLAVRIPGYRSTGLGRIPGATRFSE
jgi:hypothetical protein